MRLILSISDSTNQIFSVSITAQSHVSNYCSTDTNLGSSIRMLLSLHYFLFDRLLLSVSESYHIVALQSSNLNLSSSISWFSAYISHNFVYQSDFDEILALVFWFCVQWDDNLIPRITLATKEIIIGTSIIILLTYYTFF